MKNIEELTIKEARAELETAKGRYYDLSKLFGDNPFMDTSESNKKETDHGCCFVVLGQGFMYIGFLTTDCEFFKIDKPINIRSYTSGKGLSWHVKNGDEDMTLDRGADYVKFPREKLEHFIPTEKSLWY